MHIFYGDSITEGVPGVSFVKYINKKIKTKNEGFGGDTVIGLRNRITFDNKDNNYFYVIQIGTNDILLPFLKEYSSMWKYQVEKIIKSGRIPCNNEDQFRQEYQGLILELKEKKKSFLTINIPCIGEDLNSSLNKKIDKYNDIIKELAIECDFDYVDYNSWQKSILGKFQNRNKYFIPKQPHKMMFDSILTSLFPISNYLSSKRELVLTTDGCHLNDKGAKGLATLVEKKLK
jgi:lysophospholipase L1-like esterase